MIPARSVSASTLPAAGVVFRVVLGTLGVASTAGAQVFDAPRLVPLQGTPQAVCVDDVNGDTIADVIVGGLDAIEIHRGGGDGRLLDPDVHEGLLPTVDIEVSFVDDDLILDVVACHRQGDAVTVLLGTGDGTFTHRGTFPAGLGPNGVAVGDVNDDGDADVVVANQTGGVVSILFGDGTGDLGSPASFGSFVLPWDVALAELTGDSHPDIAVTDFWSDTVSIWRGDGSGAFVRHDSWSTGEEPTAIIAAPLNEADAYLDLTVLLRGDAELRSYLNDGAGMFTLVGTSAVGLDPRSLALGDLDGDPHPDALVADALQPRIRVLHGSASGAWSTGETIVLPALAAGGGAGRMDADAMTDVIAVLDEVAFVDDAGWIWIGYRWPDGRLKRPLSSVLPARPDSYAAGSLNDDDFPDIVVASSANQGEDAHVLWGEGDGTFTFAATIPGRGRPRGVAIADVNDDMNGDVIVAYDGTDSVQVSLGDGAGGFTETAVVHTPTAAFGLVVARLDGDAFPDVAVPCFTADSIFVLLSDGAGGFASDTTYFAGDGPQSIRAAALGPGPTLDLVYTNRAGPSPAIQVQRGAGDGTFAPATPYPTAPSPTSLVIGDLDEDLSLDAMVANRLTPAGVGLLPGNGDGTFDPRRDELTDLAAEIIELGDFDGDDHLDVALFWRQADKLITMPGDGKGAFGELEYFDTGLRPYGGLDLDVDADGTNDLVIFRAPSGLDAAVTTVFRDGPFVPVEGLIDLQVMRDGDGVRVLFRISGGPRYTSYRVERALGALGPWRGVGAPIADDGGGEHVMVDTQVSAGRYWYRLSARRRGGGVDVSAPVSIDVGVSSPGPHIQVSPNPAAGMNTVRVRVTEPTSHVVIRIIDPGGRAVRTLLDAPRPAGEHTVSWDGRDGSGRLVGAGVYLLRVSVDDRAATRRVVRTGSR